MANRKDVPYETEIQRTICDWLALRKVFFWRSNNVPVFGMSGSGVKRFRSLPKYTPRGMPDIMCVIKGKFVGLEVKRPNAKLRPEQAQFGLKLIDHGGNYHTVHSLDEVQRLPYFS